MMQRLFLLAAPALAATPAIAAEEAKPEGDAKAGPKLSFEIEAVSDYRFRGISLSGGEPALQAEALLELDSGIFASLWGSTLTGTDVELQIGLGYSGKLFNELSLEAGINYYAYPSETSQNYFEGAAALSYPIGSFTPKIGLEYAPRQAHLRDENGLKRDNLYAYVALELALAGTPVTLSGQLGYETGVFDTRANGGKWDWQVGATAETKWVNLGLFYIDSNGRLTDERGRNLAGETVVASLGRSF